MGHLRLRAAAVALLVPVAQATPVPAVDSTGDSSAIAPEAVVSTVSIVVTGVRPLPGLEQSSRFVPAALQSADGEDVERSGALDLADFMNRRLGSVHVNELQGNPYQPDVSYRGYTASPLLGTPQGMSVYMDGVRLNQPFGDVVSWDLIPRAAIGSLVLMPGSNPLFGLNTLGGALSLQTKDGRENPGTAMQAFAGSFGRRGAEFEHGGGDARGLHWFASGNAFDERGWRDRSPSNVRQLFGKLGWHDARGDVFASIMHADNRLTGNGLQEMLLLEQDRASVYTSPDETRNRATLVNAGGRRTLDHGLSLGGNLYWRTLRTVSVNGDLDAEELGDDEPAGLYTRGLTRQSGRGATLHLSGGVDHRFTVGAAYDASRALYTQTMRFGEVQADRSVVPLDEEADDPIDLDARTTTWSVFGTDTIPLGDAWRLTIAGRYDRTKVRNRDRVQSGPGSLDGDHRFARFNPSLGLSFAPTPELTAYAGYSEGSRTPSAIELGCADPDDPCRLPNAMAGDPPLRQVVARTWEAGVRRSGKMWSWRAGLFRARNDDDILFVAGDRPGFGYFRNFGRTRRQGIELGLARKTKAWQLDASYTLLDATFRSAETVGGESNSSADDDGTIRVRAGDRIPLMPRHLLKAHAEWSGGRWTMGLGMVAVSRSLARGNENGLHEGDGASSGYAVFDLNGRFRVSPRLSLFWHVGNVFDRRYATAAQLGPTGFDANGAVLAQPRDSTFLAPGAPRSVRIGLRYTFDEGV
jgi:outer membrane receptor protein involved in Fe transport